MVEKLETTVESTNVEKENVDTVMKKVQSTNVQI